MFGFISKTRANKNVVTLYQYGDISEYRSVQEQGNKRKIDVVWVKEDNIRFLAGYLGKARFGICHGTRRGLEQQWFSQYLNCEVIGTEISETAKDFPNTIQWDFHEDRPEWHGQADFVYSNSLDHAYDPAKAIANWMKCLAPGGKCIIEHSSMHENSSRLDPFGAPIEFMPYLLLQWGSGRFGVTEILDGLILPHKATYLKYLIVANFVKH